MKTENMDKRIADRRGKVEYDKRLEAMDNARRTWRNEVIQAMAARVAMAGIKPDEELELLALEFEHVAMVRSTLTWELGIDPDEPAGEPDDDA